MSYVRWTPFPREPWCMVRARAMAGASRVALLAVAVAAAAATGGAAWLLTGRPGGENRGDARDPSADAPNDDADTSARGAGSASPDAAHGRRGGRERSATDGDSTRDSNAHGPTAHAGAGGGTRPAGDDADSHYFETVVASEEFDRAPPAELVERLRAALTRGDRNLAKALEASLGRRTESAAPLMALLRDAAAPQALRDAALRVLVNLRAPGLATLVENEYLSRPPAGEEEEEDVDASRRELALRAAVAADPEGAVPVVQRLLWSSRGADRDLARAGLASARDPAFLSMLQEHVMRPDAGAAAPSLAEALARTKDAPWSAKQATGAPDTPGAGDFGTAWKAGKDSGEAWLELTYAEAVVPESVRIRETFHPGAVTRVETRLRDGTYTSLWDGGDAGDLVAAAPRWFEVTFRDITDPVRTIRLRIDPSRVAGPPQIDAVELLGGGKRQWASTARASAP